MRRIAGSEGSRPIGSKFVLVDFTEDFEIRAADELAVAGAISGVEDVRAAFSE